MPDQYDVFISHRNENKPWATTLAENLTRCGFTVFLDTWKMIPGHPIAEQLRDALERSDNAILVATPEALESGWVKDEYDMAMQKRRDNGGNFRVIPLTFGSIPKFSFLQNLHCVDFADPKPEAYRRALHQVVCGLRGRPPGNKLDLPDTIIPQEPPPPRLEDMPVGPLPSGEAVFLDDVFITLQLTRPVMLLSQADRDKTNIHRALMEIAQQEFGSDNTFHLVPAGHKGASEADYFTYLGRQLAATDPLDSPMSFEFFLDDLLRQGRPLFLLFTRVEDGNPECRVNLAKILRNLSDRYPGLLNLVLCGSEHLMALRYAVGDLSPLNTAEILFWPEPKAEDLIGWQQERFPGPDLDMDEALMLLDITGGHPLFLWRCLRLRRNGNYLRKEEYRDHLLRDASLEARFIHFRKQGEGERLCSLLKKKHLGPYLHWPEDRLLSRLFWANLLRNENGRFVWRCSLIRDIGRRVLGC